MLILALADTPTLMGEALTRLWEEYGDAWQYSLGINDLYFDFGTAALDELGLLPEDFPASISAGDGSQSAFDRIREQRYQVATVPEPLTFQGWQLVDELNRAFAGEEDSGYIAPVHLILNSNVEQDVTINNVYDPTNGYRDVYREIWGVSGEED